ncbi:tRNA preQ1(34) S-adenosylmethionine ribosyltransferase-isomerase QueA [bacterium]|jgi:S-adenosylmethionine:tRNA ribosyltransferase-isomerase|nr:tRNA preQ1(34) S-adenosylmethionine ribosyltransferase-isomerase QueA [bacterium]
MKTSEFYYELPPGLIAQHPEICRSDSRMMILKRGKGVDKILKFREIGDFLNEDDLLVVNNAKVLPCRIMAKKYPTGSDIEILLSEKTENNRWIALAKPGKRLKKGTILSIMDKATVQVENINNGFYELSFPDISAEAIMEKYGEMPLPPYIERNDDSGKARDKLDYQTVFAKEEGAVAAPTAGLHFTEELLSKIKKLGVKVVELTLNVGVGTFKPVKTGNIEEHKMHPEKYFISEEGSALINEHLSRNKRLIPVGTTVVRALESAYDGVKLKSGGSGTDLFIYPGYKFRVVKNMVTNFHLPCSTLLMLVCALAGRETVMDAYELAVKERFRFYSYGDSMFIIE